MPREGSGSPSPWGPWALGVSFRQSLGCLRAVGAILSPVHVHEELAPGRCSWLRPQREWVGDTLYTVTLERLERSRGPRRMSGWALLSRCTLPVGIQACLGSSSGARSVPEAPLEVSRYHTAFRVQSGHPREIDRDTSTSLSLGSTPAVSGPGLTATWGSPGWAVKCRGAPAPWVPGV